MIQRIQTVWLFLAVLFAALTYKFPFYNGPVTGKDGSIKPDVDLVASSNFILIVLTSGLIAGTIAIIFMYKNRKQQFWLTVVAACLSIINLVIYFYEVKKFSGGGLSLTSIFALAIPIFIILAASGIRKDEKLIKSLDRLR
jgi:heme/copper-type cytochrome/quinol oxidase subunit 3